MKVTSAIVWPMGIWSDKSISTNQSAYQPEGVSPTNNNNRCKTITVNFHFPNSIQSHGGNDKEKEECEDFLQRNQQSAWSQLNILSQTQTQQIKMH